MSWETLDDTLVRLQCKKSERAQLPQMIAMFDLDHTLVKPRKGKVHPSNATDWQWYDNTILKKLKKYNNDGYAIIIISNQDSERGGSTEKMERISLIFNEIANYFEPIYLEFYTALAKDAYRKPNTTIVEKYILPYMREEPQKIFYVGDAAGREGDFSDSDRKFAFNTHLLLKYRFPSANLKVLFATPEEFFKGEKASSKEWRGFDPKKYYEENKNDDKDIIGELDIKDQLYVILLVGPPASGKSTLRDQIINSYEDACYINQDELRTKKNCLKNFQSFLEENKKIIIVDNTNATLDTRKSYIDLVRIHEDNTSIKYQVVCIYMQGNRELYSHMNIYRERVSFHRGNYVKRVGDIVYNIYYKNYEEPQLYEDIDRLIEMPMKLKFHSKYEVIMFLQRT